MSTWGDTRRRMLSIVGAAILLPLTAAAIDRPTLVSPVNGATGQPLTLTLSWSAVAFADSYRVQVATDSFFVNIVDDRSVEDLGVSVQSVSVGPLGDNLVHFWRVAAAGQDGAISAWSPVWGFQTIASRPDTPSLVGPTNNAVNISLSDSLRWKADPISDRYRVQIATASTFSVSSIVLDTIAMSRFGFSVQWLNLPSLAHKTRYYWRVQSRKGADTSAWSTAWNFTTIVAVPPVPTL